MKTKEAKKFIFLILNIILIFTLLSSNAVALAEEIVQNVQEKAKALIEVSISKYNNFNIEEKKGTVLQFNLKTGIEYVDGQNYGAIKNTTTVAKVPEINGELPERIEVVAKSTKATNGKVKDIEGNYTYDKEKGILQLNAKNEGEEIYNNYDVLARDEYEVICVYGENVYTESQEVRNINIKAAVSEDVYNEEIGNVIQTAEINEEVSSNVGSVISTEIETEEIYDGYIKSNIANGTGYETQYIETMNVLVGYKEVGEKIVVEQSNELGNATSNIVYKNTVISKKDMMNILGENGSIKVLKEDGSVIQEINKDTEETVEGIVEVKYEENRERVILEITKPEKEGMIRIQNEKAIRGEMRNVEARKIRVNQKVAIESGEIENIQKEVEIKNATTDVNVKIDNKTFGNGITNNVVLTATLKAKDSKNNLFRNPELRITMPQEVEKVVLGDVSILYGNGLEIERSEVIDNKEGSKEIVIYLKGEQASYNEEHINEGTNVVIPANIVLKNEIATGEKAIKCRYTNEVLTGNGYETEEGNCEDIGINIVNAVNNEVNEEQVSKEEQELTPNVEQTIPEKDNEEVVEYENQGIELDVYAQVGDKKLNNGDKIHTSEIIKYVVNVKNTTDRELNNVLINCQIPENTVYATINRGTYYEEAYDYVEDTEQKEYSFVAETLAPGETKTGFYEVVVKDLEEGTEEKEIKNEIRASVDGEESEPKTLTNTLVKSKLDVFLKSYIGREGKNYFAYFLDITNLTDETIRQVQITSSELQKEMNITEVRYFEDEEDVNLDKFGNYDNGRIEGVIPQINPGQTISIEIKMKVDNFDENVNEVPLLMSVSAYSNDEKEDIYYSNENRRNAYPEYVTVEMSADKEGEDVQAGEIVTYELEVKNPSKIKTYISVKDVLPKELDGITLTYDNYIVEEAEADTEYDIEAEANIPYTVERIEKDLQEVPTDYPEVEEYIVIPAGKSVNMTFTASTTDVLETTEVSNYATVEGSDIKTVTSNIVKFNLVSPYTDVINEDEEGNGSSGNTGGNGNNSGAGTGVQNEISGLVWEDGNKDGKRDSNEQLMSGVGVKVYNANTNTLVDQTNTNTNGGYSFSNLENGSYWVLFEYDTSRYSLTAYQKGGVQGTLNSDAIEKVVSIDGAEKEVGITDTLTINNNSLSNIDMGLTTNERFNLKLDKYIDRVTVETLKGEKVYSYDRTQFAKVEIHSRDIQGSYIKVEYKVVVTNEGDTEGYVGRIVDKKPEGYEFDVTTNEGWTENNDGTLENKTLSNQFINPGETKEISLVLTKQLTEDDTGTIVNTAEIVESQSLYGTEEENKNDNGSRAELIISIETGIIQYTILTISILGILALIVLIITGRLKVKMPKNKNITNIFKVLILLIFTVGIATNSLALDIRAYYKSGDSKRYFYEYKNGKFIVSGNGYTCMNPGEPQCHYAAHYYERYDTTKGRSSSKDTTLKNVKLTKNEANIDTKALDDSNNLVGPYVLKSNQSGTSISAITLTYTQNGKVGKITSTSCLVDENGKKISLALTKNKDFKFYVKVNVNVEKINSLKITTTTKEAIQRTTTRNDTDKFKCIKVQSGKVHKSPLNPVRVSASAVQRMSLKVKRSSKSKLSATDSISYGEVLIKGRIAINKTDATTEEKLSNVGFTLKMLSGKYEGKYVNLDKNGNAIYQDEEATLITNENGEIEVNLLEPGNYELVETVNPYYGYEKLPLVINDNLNIRNGGRTVLNIENERKYIKYSGYVWEDIAWDDGKNTDMNELYQDISDDVNDKLVQNVIVRLRDKDGNIVTFKDENGNDIQEVKTDANGKYTLWDVEIDRLGELYIEFIYNGMSYTNVKYTLDKDNGNKAGEGEARKEYNKDYTKIVQGGTEDEEGNATYNLRYKQENYKSEVMYNSQDEAKEEYGYEGQRYPINGTDANFLIAATTQNAYRNEEEGKEGYLDDIMTIEEIRQNKVTDIENINLGLVERESPDISVVKDLYSAKVTINNEAHIYEYNDRFNEESEYGEGKGYEIENLDDKFNDVGVLFQEKYASMSYTRAVYPSDIKYEDQDDSKELEVRTTYKIGIRNNAMDINAKIYELQDYFDRKYEELVKVGTEINEDGSIKEGTEIEGIKAEEYEGNSEYYTMTIRNSGEKELLTIKPQTDAYVYVELKVREENLMDIVDRGEEVKLDNITEVTEYGSTTTIQEDENGNILEEEAYAGIDRDSQPGNLDVNDRSTWEDDTDKAPGLLIELQEERTVSGRVFLDETGELATGEVRQGNGQLDEGEKGIGGVEVKLVREEDNKIGQVYGEDGIWKEAVAVTDENGEYTIGGFIPGDYVIEYTWGDKTYKVQDYKSTVVNREVWEDKLTDNQWYKDEFKKEEGHETEWNNETEEEIRTSDAVDNYDERQNIDGQIKEIDYSQKQEIENAYDENAGERNEIITKLTATTPVLKVNVEYETGKTNVRDEYNIDENNQVTEKEGFKNNIRSVDFGLVKRAEQVLELDKRIKGVRVQLADGNTLINATINENGELEDETRYVTVTPKSMVNGQVKIEIDQEIIQGATLMAEYDLKIRNASEVEYQTQEFYMYGKGNGEDAEKLVTLQPGLIIDYLDNNVSNEIEENEDWKIISEREEKKELIENGTLSEEVEEKLMDANRVMITDKYADTILSPIGDERETSIEVQYKAYKLLSSTEETYIENFAEIVNVIKNNGGSTLITTPGNYVPGEESTSEMDNSSSQNLSIIPPTGLIRDYIAYTILTISSLGILISGVILIKKYVLKKD